MPGYKNSALHEFILKNPGRNSVVPAFKMIVFLFCIFLSYSASAQLTEKSEFGFSASSSFDPNIFEFNGSITAKVLISGNSAGSVHDSLFAYVGGQLRGLTESFFFTPTGTYLFPIMVFSNKGSDETIEFRYYNSQSKTLYSCKETITFIKDMIIASAPNPFLINVNAVITEAKPVLAESQAELKVYPNPFADFINIEYFVEKPAKVKLLIYDLTGRIVQMLVDERQDHGSYLIKFNSFSIPGGIYEIRLLKGERSVNRKVILSR
jgi:hypothetical protein